jgi:uncharacterized membrane protein YphA (DoxX/SURF4 family)
VSKFRNLFRHFGVNQKVFSKFERVKSMQSYTKFQDAALLALRLIGAAIFLNAAYVKLPLWSFTPEGMPAIMVGIMKLLTIAEPLGALALILGFLTRWAASGLSIIMVGAILVTQLVWGIGFSTATAPGWNFPLAVLAGCIVLVTFGAGRWSIDAKRGK